MRKDIDFSFRAHPLTGDLATKSGSAAIKQALVNLVRTGAYNRGFNVELVSNVDSMLFENDSILTSQQIRDNLTVLIENWEEQVELIDVEVFVNARYDNTLDVKIYYTEMNDPQEKTLMITLDRVR